MFGSVRLGNRTYRGVEHQTVSLMLRSIPLIIGFTIYDNILSKKIKEYLFLPTIGCVKFFVLSTLFLLWEGFLNPILSESLIITDDADRSGLKRYLVATSSFGK
ncbi:hypothetical protein C6501_19270 [Candidatus Poribacteria bacterium]|nr:MAG: hypothetical protein C6501_19270 [Candidatus Poribacteria bacterium]